MNYELTMLKNALRMRKAARRLSREMQTAALTSYDTTDWRGGTLAQMQAMAELSERVNVLNAFFQAVREGLLRLTAAHRTLLVEVYVKRCDRARLAERYKVSLSTVYRKLAVARGCFRRALESLGCTEQWFNESFCGYDWIVNKRQ